MIYLKLVDPNYKYGCLYICVDSHILILSILLFKFRKLTKHDVTA